MDKNTEIKNRLTSIIILTYNKLEYTKMCIESIRKFTNKNSYEIIVVDNNSQDDTVDWLKQQNDLKVIFNKENLGFPKGCNQGIEISKGDSILLLNNDVIVTPNWLYNLDKALYSSDNIGAVGAVSNNCSYAQQIETNYKDIDEMIEFAYKYNISNEEKWQYRTKLIGFCMLIKKEVLNKVGLLDEIFTPGNFEDDDLSFRIIGSGYKLLLCKDVFIHHFGSVSFGEKINEYKKILDINEKKFEDKWGFSSKYSNFIRFDLINEMDEKDKNKDINVLEIGCGTGATLLEIKSIYKNSNIYGIEIDKNSAKIAKNNCDLITGNVEEMDLPYEENFFDYIILGDVLEHLINPWETLNKLDKYLKNGGKVISSIPNIMHISVVKELLAGNFTYQKSGILDKTHLRFFTLKEIEKMFNNNYEICDIKAIYIDITSQQEELINKLCETYGNNLKEEYKVYQYVVIANKKKKEVNNMENLNNNTESIEEYKNKLSTCIKTLINNNKFEDANKLINEYESIIGKDINTLTLKGIIHFSIGEINEAKKLFIEALEIDKYNVDINYNLGFICKNDGNYYDSYKYYYTAFKYTEDLDLKNEISSILLEFNDIDGFDKEYMWPKVTIAITAYNQKDYLREAIEGCLDQDYPNLEVLVIDDCSTDGTDKMVQDYINKIRYVRNEVNIGPGNNSYNILYNLINSPYAISFNHDDYLIKRDYVSTAINMFKNNPNLSIIWANCKIKDETTGQFSVTNFNNQEIMSGIEYFKNYETKGYPHICGQLTTIYDVNKLRKAGYGKERTKSKDTFACLKLMLQGDIGFIKDCVAVYRVHKKSLSFNMDSEYDMSTIEEFEKLKMEVLMQKRASNEEMEIWLNNRIRAYILWRFSTLWNNNDKKGALNLMYKIHNKYPKAYEIIVNEL